MSRSLKKGPYVDEKLLARVKNMKPGDKSELKTWARRATITPEMVGFSFGVHNGKTFVKIQVGEEMVGHKLGEFSPTTKFQRHGGKMQKELEQKATAGAPIPAPASGSGKPASSPKGSNAK